MVYRVTNIRGETITDIKCDSIGVAAKYVWDKVTERRFFARSYFEKDAVKVAVSKNSKSDVLTIKEVK